MCTTNSAAALKSLYEESLVVAFREEAHCESTGALTGLVS